MLQKTKRVRLKGQALNALNNAIHERDGDKCVICGKYVDRGQKWHHVYFGSGRKSDVIEEGVTLCYGCHQDTHFNADVMKENTRKCIEYLDNIYKGG